MSPELSKVTEKVSLNETKRLPVRSPGVGQAGRYQLKRDLSSRKGFQASGQACSRGAAHRATAPLQTLEAVQTSGVWSVWRTPGKTE